VSNREFQDMLNDNEKLQLRKNTNKSN